MALPEPVGIPPLEYDHPPRDAFPTTPSFRTALSDLVSLFEEAHDDNNPQRPTGRKRRRPSGTVDDGDGESGIGRVVLHATADAVCLYDKYPKARRHVLLVPRPDSALGDVRSISDLVPGRHLERLREFHRLGRSIAERIRTRDQAGSAMMLGYHAVPSLALLHLHIISSDLDSECVKNKKHVNSFANRQFFVSPESLESHLSSAFAPSVRVQVRTERARELLTTSPLRCRRCGQTSGTVPAWKRHNASCPAAVSEDEDGGNATVSSILGWERQSPSGRRGDEGGEGVPSADIRGFFVPLKRMK